MPAAHLPLDFILIAGFLSVLSGAQLSWVNRVLPEEDLLFKGLIACAAGLLATAYLTFLLGVLGYLKPALFMTLWVLCAAAAVRPLYQTWTASRQGSLQPALTWTPFEKALGILLVVLVVSQWLFAYAPPTAEDELVYHISMPRLYVQWGKFPDTPNNLNTYFPFNSEMIYTALLLLRNVLTVKTMVVATSWLTGAALYVFSRQRLRFSRTETLLALTLWYAAPFTISMSGITAADFLNVFFELLVFSLYWEWRQRPTPAVLCLMGVLAGAGMGTRPYALVWVFLLAVLMLYDKKPKEMFIFLAIAGIVFLPWPLRTALLTGNPAYPQALWKSAAFDPYFRAMLDTYVPTTHWVLWFLPLYIASGFGSSWIWGVGPLAVAFAPFAFLRGSTDTNKGLLGWLAIGTLTLLAFVPASSFSPRYFNQSFPFIILLAVRGLSFLMESMTERKARFLKATVLLLLVFPSTLFSAYMGARRIPFAIGRQSWDEYLSAHYHEEGYPMMQYLHSRVPRDRKLLFLGYVASTSGFYYPDYAFLSQSTFPPDFYRKTSEEFARALAEQGIVYLLLPYGGFKSNPDGSWSDTYLPSLNLTLPPLRPPTFRLLYDTPESALFENTLVKTDPK